VLRRLFSYLLPYKWWIVVAGALLLLGTPAQLFHPLVWLFVVDEVVLAEEPRFIEYVGGSRVNLLLAALGVMLVVHVVGTALGAVRTYVLGVVGQRFVFDLRADVYRRIQDHALPFFHRHRSGDLVARTMGDIDSLEEVAIRGTDEIVSSVIQFVVVAAIIVWLNVWVGTLTLVPLLGVFVLVVLFNRRIKGLYRRVRDRLGDVSAKLQENLSGILVIKAFAREGHEADEFARRNRAYFETSIRAVIARAFYFPAVYTVGFTSNLVMIGLGGYFVLTGRFTIGGLVAYRGYWWQLFSPVQSLARINEMIQRALAAASRVFDLMDEPVEVTDAPDAVELEAVAGRIEFDAVSFAYTERQATLREVSFVVEPGQRIGVVGPSGAGKSTLLALLLRLYDPSSGVVRIDGRDLRSVTQRSLRRRFGVVTQEPFLFNDTIRANIAYGRPDADDAAVEAAATQANAHEFILGLPRGYDTVVGERGVKLSGGQKQRISIARALLSQPSVLLLDEATASVEPESESIIQQAVTEASRGRTSIIVSHRLSMVRDADEIVVVSDGRITERGSHEALMGLEGGWYARMYRLQMVAGPASAGVGRLG
jgi:ATP-binding cassette subfamily B protein